MTTFIDGKTQDRLGRLIAGYSYDEQADLRTNGIQSALFAWLTQANCHDPFWADVVLQQLQAQR